MKKVEDGIWGLAAADALGVPVEFVSREKLKENPVTGMREYGTHNQPKGTWSDDTSMTLALMDSLAECGTVDEVDILNRFSGWLLYGDYTPFGEVFDVGNTVSRALFRYGKGIQPTECGGRAETDNGNGRRMNVFCLLLNQKSCQRDR